MSPHRIPARQKVVYRIVATISVAFVAVLLTLAIIGTIRFEDASVLLIYVLILPTVFGVVGFLAFGHPGRSPERRTILQLLCIILAVVGWVAVANTLGEFISRDVVRFAIWAAVFLFTTRLVTLFGIRLFSPPLPPLATCPHCGHHFTLSTPIGENGDGGTSAAPSQGVTA